MMIVKPRNRKTKEFLKTLQATTLMMIVIAGLVALKLEIWVPNLHR
jgi:hypothetical protein